MSGLAGGTADVADGLLRETLRNHGASSAA